MAKPCKRCGGPKMAGQGQRFCAACKEATLPIWQQRAYLRSRAKYEKEKAQRLAQGKTPRSPRTREDGTVLCGGCKEFLPPQSFATAGKSVKGVPRLNAYCRHCASRYNHERNLRTKFGITPDEYDRLLTLQDGMCAICLKRPRKVRLAVDHDHKTGAVRGLLCSRCNHKLLGGANDSMVMLERAAAYLEAPPATSGLAPQELPHYWERRLEHEIDLAETANGQDPDSPPVAHIDLADGQQIVAMHGSTFVGLLRSYELATGVPLTITVQHDTTRMSATSSSDVHQGER